VSLTSPLLVSFSILGIPGAFQDHELCVNFSARFLETTFVMLCLSGLFGTWHCQMMVMRMLEALELEIEDSCTQDVMDA
jgi:hypothetical protein